MRSSWTDIQCRFFVQFPTCNQLTVYFNIYYEAIHNPFHRLLVIVFYFSKHIFSVILDIASFIFLFITTTIMVFFYRVPFLISWTYIYINNYKKKNAIHCDRLALRLRTCSNTCSKNYENRMFGCWGKVRHSDTYIQYCTYAIYYYGDYYTPAHLSLAYLPIFFIIFIYY